MLVEDDCVRVQERPLTATHGVDWIADELTYVKHLYCLNSGRKEADSQASIQHPISKKERKLRFSDRANYK
jgi:hypothetical protein